MPHFLIYIDGVDKKSAEMEIKNMEYYLVTTKCGHLGRRYYIPITFPIRAENGREAAKIARRIPRVKHDHWDAIIKCEKVGIEEYLTQMIVNACDSYLHVTSTQEQKLCWDEIEGRMMIDNHQEEKNELKPRGNRPNLWYQSQKYLKARRRY